MKLLFRGLEDIHVCTFRELRESVGLNEMEMALKCQVSLGTLRNWESGRSLPGGNPITMERYCQAYGVDLATLVAACIGVDEAQP